MEETKQSSILNLSETERANLRRQRFADPNSKSTMEDSVKVSRLH